MEIDDELESSSSYSGTFRWKKGKKLPQMPGIKNDNMGLQDHNQFNSIDWTRGWKQYFTTRGNLSTFSKDNGQSGDPARALIQYAFNDLSLVDCLSFPLSIACFFHTNAEALSLSFHKHSYDKLTVICIGCSEKAEERVLTQTNAFLELQLALLNVRTVDVWLVGPEVSSTADNIVVNSRKLNKNFDGNSTISFSLFRGTVSTFVRAHPECLAGESIVIGYNCGFGNFENPLPKRYDLFLSWLPDLVFLTSTQLPLVFFCANDYADLVGEVSIMMHILGANFISLPAENPFSFASTMIPPASNGKRPEEEYARGNSFFYAVQGSDKMRKNKDILAFKSSIEANKSVLIGLLTQSLSTAVLSRCLKDVERCFTTGELELKALPVPAEINQEIVQSECSDQRSNVGDPISSSPCCVVQQESSSLLTSRCENLPYTTDQAIRIPIALVAEQNIRSSGLIVQQSITNDSMLVVEVALVSYVDASFYNLKSAEVDVNGSGESMHICVPTELADPLQDTVHFIHRIRVSEGLKAKYSKKNKTLNFEFHILH
ncbi:hypothetical protein EON65_34575 [archaeon]|nr:MAG: hypothetical protein EON65_34575 [archaeon]